MSDKFTHGSCAEHALLCPGSDDSDGDCSRDLITLTRFGVLKVYPGSEIRCLYVEMRIRQRIPRYNFI